MEPTPHSSSNPQRRAILAEMAPPYNGKDPRGFALFTEDYRMLMEAKHPEREMNNRDECKKAWEKLSMLEKLAFALCCAADFDPEDSVPMSEIRQLRPLIAVIRRNRLVSCLMENGEKIEVCVESMKGPEEQRDDEATNQDDPEPSTLVHRHPEWTDEDFAYYSGSLAVRVTTPDIPAYNSEAESGKDDDDDENDMSPVLPMLPIPGIENVMMMDVDEEDSTAEDEDGEGGGNVVVQQLENPQANVEIAVPGPAANPPAAAVVQPRRIRGRIPSYIFFSLEKRAELKGVRKITHQELGQLWDDLDAAGRAPYQAMAAADRDRYEAEMADA